MLDILQEENKHLYKGKVLDIGGRDRGYFIKPRDKVEEWIFADINKNHYPDIVLDVANMIQIKSNSIDVVNAIELFEHVENIEKGLDECYRILKDDGIIFISIPFLYQIHADPFDYQRWTATKWKIELEKRGFKIEKIIIMGKYFSHLSEILKDLLKSIDRKYRGGFLLLRFFNPILNTIRNLDTKTFIKNDPVLNNFHNGYFIIAKKMS